MKYKYTFTIFTPTYNRVDKIDRVYDSLKKQTFRDFEWLVVDDGSLDDTKELITKWREESNFSIRYIYQDNKGKHIAFNNGVKHAQGRFFLPADSDDEFLEDALKILYDTWKSINNKEEYSGVTGLCIDANTGKIVGDQYPSDIFDSTTLESTYTYNIQGEKWGFHKTDVLKKFPFPQFGEEKFSLESFVWTAIGRKYKTRYINQPLRIYYQNEGENLSSIAITYPLSSMEWYMFEINNNFDYLIKNRKKFLIAFINLGRMQIHAKKDFMVTIRRLNSFNKKIIFMSIYLFSRLFAMKDKKEGRV